MAGLYIDTSAFGRLLLGDPERPAIRETLSRYEHLFSSELLVLELRRLGARASRQAETEKLLTAVELEPLLRSTLEAAATVQPLEVRSLDAIHLATAVDLHLDGRIVAVLTYDKQLQAGCAHHGIAVEAPDA